MCVCIYVGVYMCVCVGMYYMCMQSCCASPVPLEEIFVSKTLWILFRALRSGGHLVNSLKTVLRHMSPAVSPPGSTSWQHLFLGHVIPSLLALTAQPFQPYCAFAGSMGLQAFFAGDSGDPSSLRLGGGLCFLFSFRSVLLFYF